MKVLMIATKEDRRWRENTGTLGLWAGSDGAHSPSRPRTNPPIHQLFRYPYNFYSSSSDQILDNWEWQFRCAELELWKTTITYECIGIGKPIMQQTPFHWLLINTTKNTYLRHSATQQATTILWLVTGQVSACTVPQVYPGHPGLVTYRHRDCWSYPPLYNVCNVQSNVSPGY